MTESNILITGVGGQGNILASDVIGEVALAAGLDVKKQTPWVWHSAAAAS
jgi:Pyruvate/2-oxoacid:ferredoxin oxidoreductase gamma subunit